MRAKVLVLHSARLNRPGFAEGSHSLRRWSKKITNRFSPEVRERAVRMGLEHGRDHASQWATMSSIASKIGCTGEASRK
jgi:transposase-like protein